jgi:cysteine dioxygenase
VVIPFSHLESTWKTLCLSVQSSIAASLVVSTSTSIAMALNTASLSFGLAGNVSTKDVAVAHGNQFDDLVAALKEALGPSSGLTCDDIDVDFLSQLMAEYDCSDDQWRKYAFGNKSMGYTRNLVDEGNGKSNLVRCHG